MIRKSTRYRLNQRISRPLQALAYRLCLPLSRPTQVVVNITERCNLNCRHCSAWQKRTQDRVELTPDEWKRTFADLRKWLGTFQLVFSGGEPFLRPDISELVRFCSDMGIVTTVVTNGTLLDERRITEVTQARLDNLVISLDGAKAKTHNYIRGREGAYRKTVASIERVRAMNGGPSLTISTVIVRQNQDELIDLVRMVSEKGLDGIIFQVMLHDFWGSLPDPDPAWYADHELWVEDTEHLLMLLDRLIESRDSYRIVNPTEQLRAMKQYFLHPDRPLQNQPCFVAVRNLFFGPTGDMSLCFRMMHLGNVKTIHPRLAWRSKQSYHQRLAIRRCHKSCLLLNCNFPIIW